MTCCPSCGVSAEPNYADLVKRAAAGDQDAIGQLYLLTYEDKYYVALKYMKKHELAEDVLQDAYLRAFQNLDQLKEPEKFPSWLAMIVANTAKNQLRKNNPILFSDVLPDAYSEETPLPTQEEIDRSALPEDAYLEKERAELVRQLMDSLTDEQRVCVMMYYVEGLGVREIAEALELNENTVKSRLFKARRALNEKGEDMKKRGYVFSVAPLPLLLLLLRGQRASFSVTPPAMPAQAVGQVSAAKSAAVGTAKVSAAAAGKAAGGFLATAAGKIIAVAAAVVLIVGGVGAAIVINNADASRNTETETADTQLTETDADPLLTDSFEYAESDAAAESEGETENSPEAENEDFTAAYAAYDAILTQEKDLIDGYAEWVSHDGILKPVAIFDIMGDATPELVYVALPAPKSSQSYLNIVTWRGGEAVTVLSESWDFFVAGGLQFILYQSPNQKTLYARTVMGDAYTATEHLRFAEDGNGLNIDRLRSFVSYEEDPPSYQWQGQSVSADDFDAYLEEFPFETGIVKLSNEPGYDAQEAMTCEEALAFLNNAR